MVMCRECGKREDVVSSGLMMPWCDACHHKKVDANKPVYVDHNGLIKPVDAVFSRATVAVPSTKENDNEAH